MKILFLGTPLFAVTILESILKTKHEVIGVVCQPDKPTGRGHKLTAPPVKVFAMEHNIPCYQFDRIRKHAEEIKKLSPDIMITAAFGQILDEKILSICPVFNVHGSLLPKLRGAAPIEWAILNGETSTGITIMCTDVGIDTGDMILSEKLVIDPDDTTESLSNKLSQLGAKLIIKFLELYEKGEVRYIKQPGEFSYARMLKKEDGKLDFYNNSAEEIKNKVRALSGVTGTYFDVGNERYLIYKVSIINDDDGFPGQIICQNKRLIIKAKDFQVEILLIKAQGGKMLDSKTFLNGRKLNGEFIDK